MSPKVGRPNLDEVARKKTGMSLWQLLRYAADNHHDEAWVVSTLGCSAEALRRQYDSLGIRAKNVRVLVEQS